MVVRRTVGDPLRGMSTTTTVHVPFRTPRMDIPTNRHERDPLVMLMRMEPFDRLGIFMETAAAMRRAVMRVPRRNDTGRTSDLVVTVGSVVEVAGVVAGSDSD